MAQKTACSFVMEALRKGEAVEVFYRFSQDSGGYFPTALGIGCSSVPA